MQDPIQLPPQNGLRPHDDLASKRLAAIGAVINWCRAAQNWQILGVADTTPIAQVWMAELDRHDVRTPDLRLLYQMAIDHRVKIIREGGRPPDLALELFLAMHKQHVGQLRLKHARDIAVAQTQESIERLKRQGEDPQVIEEYESVLRKLSSGQ